MKIKKQNLMVTYSFLLGVITATGILGTVQIYKDEMLKKQRVEHCKIDIELGYRTGMDNVNLKEVERIWCR